MWTRHWPLELCLATLFAPRYSRSPAGFVAWQLFSACLFRFLLAVSPAHAPNALHSVNIRDSVMSELSWSERVSVGRACQEVAHFARSALRAHTHVSLLRPLSIIYRTPPSSQPSGTHSGGNSLPSETHSHHAADVEPQAMGNNNGGVGDTVNGNKVSDRIVLSDHRPSEDIRDIVSSLTDALIACSLAIEQNEFGQQVTVITHMASIVFKDGCASRSLLADARMNFEPFMYFVDQLLTAFAEGALSNFLLTSVYEPDLINAITADTPYTTGTMERIQLGTLFDGDELHNITSEGLLPVDARALDKNDKNDKAKHLRAILHEITPVTKEDSADLRSAADTRVRLSSLAKNVSAIAAAPRKGNIFSGAPNTLYVSDTADTIATDTVDIETTSLLMDSSGVPDMIFPLGDPNAEYNHADKLDLPLPTTVASRG